MTIPIVESVIKANRKVFKPENGFYALPERAEFNYSDICGICSTQWTHRKGWTLTQPRVVKCDGCGSDWGVSDEMVRRLTRK